MLRNEYICGEFNDIIAILNAKDYPETYDFISMLLSSDEKEYPGNYDIATGLVKCDNRLSMHKVVFDFTVEPYEAEIKNKNANAMNDLGALYYDGHGCCKDFSKAEFTEGYYYAGIQ